MGEFRVRVRLFPRAGTEPPSLDALVAPEDAPVLLGATTLEELGLGIDPQNRRLVPVDLYLAAERARSRAPRVAP